MALQEVPKLTGVPAQRSSSWGWPFVLGLALVAVGVFALIAAGITGIASVLLFGALLAASGIAEIIGAFVHRKESRFVLQLLAGILSAAVGVLMVVWPLVGLAAVSLLIIGYFFASGLFHAITAVADRYPNWGLDFAYGLAAIALGVIGVSQWPLTLVWLVGTLVGLEILFRGLNLMSWALAFRKASRPLSIPAGR
ncbi:MAG: HdeD family acid-resistance protein [Myxococcaceae bacterium]